MKTLKKIMILLCSMSVLTLFSACEEQGPAERAGEQIDESVEQTRESLEEAGEEMEDAGKEMGEKADGR